MAESVMVAFPETDYAAIEEAIVVSGRGRWFLEQYLKRNRPSETQNMLGTLHRLADLVEKQENQLAAVLKPEDRALIQRALRIVGHYLSTEDGDTLVGLAHNLEENARILALSGEKLVLAVARLKMGHVDDATLTEIVDQVECIEEAKQHTHNAKTKIATLFQALSLLEKHLQELCDGYKHDAVAFDPKTELPNWQSTDAREDNTPSQTSASVDADVAIDASEEVQEPVLTQAARSQEFVAEEVVSEPEQQPDPEPESEPVSTISDQPIDEDNDGDDDDPNGGGGSRSQAREKAPAKDDTENLPGEMSEDDIDALFASSKRRSAPKMTTFSPKEPVKAEKEFVKSEQILTTEKLAEAMASKVQNSFQAKMAEQQLKFFAGNRAVKLKAQSNR